MPIFTRFLAKLLQMKFTAVLMLGLAIVIVSSIFIHMVEPDQFPTFFEALWWVMTTVVTVGYGDVSPETTAGKIFTMITLYIFGIGIVGVLIGKIMDSLGTYQRLKEEGKVSYSKNDHFIFIGSINKIENAIKEILDSNSKATFVIIGEDERKPIDHDAVHFIQGDPSDEETLMRANILEARCVSIFADDQITNSVFADGKTLLIASAVEALSAENQQEIYTIVEIMKENHISKFKHINIDEFILSNEAISRLIAQASLHKGSSELFRQLMSKKYGDNLYEIRTKPNWKNYKDAFIDLLEEGATLVADRHHLNINRKLDEKIPNDAKLFVVCDEQTYHKIK